MKVSYECLRQLNLQIERIQRWQKRWSKIDEAQLHQTALRSLTKLRDQLESAKKKELEAIK